MGGPKGVVRVKPPGELQGKGRQRVMINSQRPENEVGQFGQKTQGRLSQGLVRKSGDHARLKSEREGTVSKIATNRKKTRKK